MTIDNLHEQCPDRAKLPRDDWPTTREELLAYGPNEGEAAIRLYAESVTASLAAQRDQWRQGFTRRRVVAGAGAVGVAALGSQLVTTKVAFADPATTKRSLIVVFLRGGLDSLSMLAPIGDADLAKVRPTIGIPASQMLPAGRNFGFHPVMAPLMPFYTAGKLAAVHAVASPDVSRSHFQAQDCIERGAAATNVGTGWLDRFLEASGPGTAFRAVAEGTEMPRSLVGQQDKIVMAGLEQFRLSGSASTRPATMEALAALYTGIEHPLAVQAKVTLDAITAAQRLASTGYTPSTPYPNGGFADDLSDIARLIKAQVGLRVATVDLGGFDTHTNMGTVANGEMRNHLTEIAAALTAFATDLGPLLDDVTLVTMSEFGRRVVENANAGTDHGHGGAMLLLGGGLDGGKVHGAWPGLAPSALDHDDVAGANDYRNVVGDVLTGRFGIGDLSKIFPGYSYRRIGVCG